jgi:hypothetical protein
MKQNQMWTVQLYKKQYLDERQVLVTTEKITEVVADFTQLYEGWEDGDSIVIKPTEMKYYG